MKLLRFLALFFATITRRHRKPPTARTPSREKTEEELAQEYVANAIAQLERIFAQWKAGTLPAHMLAKPTRARKTTETLERETPEPAPDSPKTGPNRRPIPPPRRPAAIAAPVRPENRTVRRTKGLRFRTPSHGLFITNKQ